MSLPVLVVAAFAALAPAMPGGGLRLRVLGGQLHAAFNAADLAWSAATATSSKLLGVIGGGGAVGGGPGGLWYKWALAFAAALATKFSTVRAGRGGGGAEGAGHGGFTGTGPVCCADGIKRPFAGGTFTGGCSPSTPGGPYKGGTIACGLPASAALGFATFGTGGRGFEGVAGGGELNPLLATEANTSTGAPFAGRVFGGTAAEAPPA